MKKDQDRLNSKEERARLGAREKDFSYEYVKSFSARRKRKFKRWYGIYAVTLGATALCVILLLLFGMSGSRRPLAQSIGLGGLADKIGSIMAGLDFPFDKENQGGTDTTKAPPEEGSDSATQATDSEPPSTDVSVSTGGLYDFDYSKVPEGHTPIIPMDLSLKNYGPLYINNSTGYTPNIETLLKMPLGSGQNGVQAMSLSNGPVVLIVHTHGTEGYSPDGAISVPDEAEFARTSDTSKNVVSIGKLISDILNKNGVPTVHCTVMHDSIQYKDSYLRAEETIRKYLEEYPTIKLVIDIHRDSIIKSSGEIVRPVAELDGEAAAQLMCVVGTDWEGDSHPKWENNLSLALKLRELLNDKCENICRPVFLKSHTYNQEIAPYSLLIEVGSGGNSLEEAQRSAVLLAEKLCVLVKNI